MGTGSPAWAAATRRASSRPVRPLSTGLGAAARRRVCMQSFGGLGLYQEGGEALGLAGKEGGRWSFVKAVF